MWNIAKIKSYIENGVEENLHLDYKAAGALEKTDKKRAEISKDVSAFANSDGGIIIYGIREFSEKGKQHLPSHIDPVDRRKISKEWLEQVINSNISPKVNNIIISPVPYGNSTDGKVLYVVEIPKSNTAHQAKDKRYYKRYNFESTPMEDYEIKDIINRSKKTSITISFKPVINLGLLKQQLKTKQNFDVILNVRAFNKGNLVSQYLSVFLLAEKKWSNLIIESPPKSMGTNNNDFEILFENKKENKIKIFPSNQVIGTERVPILPNTSQLLGSIKVNSRLFLCNVPLKVQISTEDDTRTISITGIELITGK